MVSTGTFYPRLGMENQRNRMPMVELNKIRNHLTATQRIALFPLAISTTSPERHDDLASLLRRSEVDKQGELIHAKFQPDCAANILL